MTCKCETPPFQAADFESRFVGVDPTNGRYGEVSVDTCRQCGTRWLDYLVEYEGFSGSSRWFRAAVGEDVARLVTPESAIDEIERAPVRFAGGSLFGSTGSRHTGRAKVDL